MQKDESFEVKTLTVHYKGDETVGEFSRNYELTGGFIFENANCLAEFKDHLATAFQWVEHDNPTWILTDTELKAMEMPEFTVITYPH